MRTSEEAIFFKNEEAQLSRFWIDLEDGNEYVYNQLLVGYMNGATYGIDDQIDGEMFGYEGPALYSIIGEQKFSIQGRSLPFEKTDVVPLGFQAETEGKFRVHLSAYEGLFTEGEVFIFIRDKTLGITHNLMESDYEFESEAGEFRERFEIVYLEESEMGTHDHDLNAIQIYKDRDYIVVESQKEQIRLVELYDLAGRRIFKDENINQNHHRLKSDYLGTQILVVKVQTADGEVTTKKLIN